MTSWLYRDARENYKHVYNAITDEFLQATYASLETNLAVVIKLTTNNTQRTFTFSSANQYVSGLFSDGRITDVNAIERSMPTLFSPTVEFSELSFTIANQDAKYSSIFLPAQKDYVPLHNAKVEFTLAIPDKEQAFRVLFRGNVKYTDGVSFTHDSITIKATDELANQLSALPPLEVITQEAFPRCAKESIGKLIPLNLGDFVAGFNATEIGLSQVKVDDNTYNVKSYNVSGGGVIGYYIDYYYADQSGGVFLFQTGGRANKTYYIEYIRNVFIKRGNGYLSCNFNPIPRVVAGHWCVDVFSLKGRNADDTADIDIPYFYQDGDIAIISTRFPISGYAFDAERDASPLMQAKELLIALSRVSEDKISQNFNALNAYLRQRYASNIYASDDTITIVIPDVEYSRDEIVGAAFAIQVPLGDSLYNTRKAIIYMQDTAGTIAQPRELALLSFLNSENADVVTQALITTSSQNIPANKITSALIKALNTLYLNAVAVKIENNYIIVAKTQTPQRSTVVASVSRVNMPSTIDIVFTKGGNKLVLAGISPLMTRISINESVKDKPIVDTISSLLKCVLCNLFVNKSLKIDVCSLLYENISNKDTSAYIEQFEISAKDISFSSETFFTSARANYNWLGWMRSAANQTAFLRNQYAESNVGEVRKEIDLPYIYTEDAARFVISRYVSFASAGLIIVKLELPFRYLFLDVGDKVIVTINTGSVVYENIPMLIRKISINSNLTTCKVEGLFFANYLLPNYNYGNSERNLSNYNTPIV